MHTEVYYANPLVFLLTVNSRLIRALSQYYSIIKAVVDCFAFLNVLLRSVPSTSE